MSPKRTLKHKLKHGCGIAFIMMLTSIVVLSGIMLFYYSRTSAENAYRVSGTLASVGAQKYLEITIDGVDETFHLYLASRDYGTFLSQLHPGDSVTLYTPSANVYEIIQLEKSGGVLYSVEGFRTKYRWISIFLLLAGGFMCFLVVKAWKKYMV